MLLKNSISIFRNNPPIGVTDYYLSFTGEGYIQIDSLSPFLDYKTDFYFEMQFKINNFPKALFSFLMNSCYDINSNKIGIAVDGSNLYVQLFKGIDDITELFIPFTGIELWHTLSVSNAHGSFSASLDGASLSINYIPKLSLPAVLGFKIAADTALANGLSGSVDNIQLTDLYDPIAQYPFYTGSGEIAKDVIAHYEGSIINGVWRNRS